MTAVATTLDPGKTRSLQRVTSSDGFFLICALDHLSDFAELLAPDPSTVTYEQTCQAKLELISRLAPSVSAFLLDPLFALGPALTSGTLPGSVGLMASIEDEGYHGRPGARKTSFREGWSARKIKLIGADVCKLLWFYRPEADTAGHQREVVKRLVEECSALSLPLVVEPIWYPLEGEDPASEQWKQRRVEGILTSAEEANGFGVDMLKVEFPGDVDTDEGHEAAADACRRLDQAISVPWVILSAGVGFEDFKTQVQIACAAGASGYLAGRSIWRDAVTTHNPQQREDAFRAAQARLEDLNAVTRTHGRPYNPAVAPSAAIAAFPEGWYTGWHGPA
jgi:tagatose 1,6-diphosphate aldolase